MKHKQRTLPMRASFLFLLALLAIAGSLLGVSNQHVQLAHAENNGQGSIPFKGWSTWSYIGKNPTATNVYAQAQLLVSSGLAKAGYNYVLLDESKKNSDGSFTVAFFNLSGSAANVSVSWSAIGTSGTKALTNLWTGGSLGNANGYSASVPSHGTLLFSAR